MAKDQTKRLKPSNLTGDQNSLAALKNITTYAPANPAYSMAALTTLEADMLAAETAEAQAEAALATARDVANAREWAFHNATIGMRDQVMAQYGRDSNEAQAVGRKKTSERKSSTSKKGQK